MSSDRRAGLGRSTAVMAAGTGVSRVLGVARSTVLVTAIGLNAAAADAFQVANWLPNLLYMLVAGGVLNAVLVPQVVRAYRSADGQTFVDRLLTLSIVLLLGLTAVLTLAAPLIIRVAAGGTEPEFTTLATAFAFWCIPQLFFYGLYTLLGQVLNARGQFGPYMWAPVVNNMVAIAGLLTFIALFGRHIAEGPDGGLDEWGGARIALLAGSATLGVVVQALVLIVPLYRSGFRYRPRGGWRGAGLSTAGRVAGWTFAALAIGQVGILVVVRVASAAAQSGFEAGIAGYNAYTIGFMIFMLPHSLITVSLLTALFTRLSDHAAARQTQAVRADFSFGLRTVSVFTLFASVAIAVLALPLVRTLYPGTSPEEAATMPPIITSFMVGLVALGAWSLCQRVFYAYEDAKGLFRIQAAMAGVVVGGTLAGYLLLEPERWVATAALSMSASYIVGAVWGGAEVWGRLGGSLGRAIRLHTRAGIAAAVAGGTGWLVSRVFGDLVSGGFIKALLACVVVGLVMLAVYLGLLRAMGVGEADDLLRPIMARLRRTMSSAEAATAADPSAELGSTGDGGAHVDDVIGRGTLLAGRYRLHQRTDSDLPGVQCWSARDQILDRPVRALIVREGNVHAIQDAARRAALVPEPRLLKVLDVGDHEGIAYTVTEPVVGQHLGELTVRGPLPADQARAIVAEAAAALEVARRRGVHHLALRPSAVRVTPDGTVMVTGLSMDGELFGHEATGAKATSRADTVGLVALLYLGLTGRWPTHPGSPEVDDVAIAPVVDGAPVPPSELTPGVPNDLDTLCAVTLGADDDGPHSPGELVRELEPWGPVRVPEAFGALETAAATAVIQSAPWSATVAQATTGPDAPTTTMPPVTDDAPPVDAPPVAPPVERTTAWGPADPTPGARRPARAGGATAVTPTAVRPPVPAAVRPSAPDRRPLAGLPPVGDVEDFDDLVSGDDEPLINRRFNAAPIVLGVFLVTIVVGLVLAWKAMTAPVPPVGGEDGLDLGDEPVVEEPLAPEDDDPGDGEDAEDEAEPEADEEPAAAPVISSAQQIDPPPDGDENEHPEAVDRAIDGDPETYWFSRTYVSPTYGMKSGIGFAVTLAEPAEVSTVELDLNSTGGMVEVRATSPSTPTDGDPLESGPMSPTTTFTFDPVTTEHIVLWFPELPQNPDGANRIELFEIRVS